MYAVNDHPRGLVWFYPLMGAKRILITAVLLAGNALAQTVEKDLVAAAIERTHHTVRYDGGYFSIDYPGGDVPEGIGVCTDVVIRAFRSIGADLQRLVHEDMLKHFDDYPSKRIWGLTRTDRNIDHRRVPNLQTFFSRHGQELPVSSNPKDYAAGDLVTWLLPGNLPHIGIVTDQFSRSGNPLIVHNIGAGPKLEDSFFAYDITGHYSYVPGIFPNQASADEMSE